MRQARAQGYRSRAAFKLIEIDARDRLLRPGATVVDLGAAPGSWSQVAARKVGPRGRVIAVDLQDMSPIPGVTVLQADFRHASVLEALRGAKADLVLSDLSPNISGIASVDQARSAELALAAIGFCRAALKPEGALLIKAFQGEAFAGLRAELKRAFQTVVVRKPRASRGESRETYLLARQLSH